MPVHLYGQLADMARLTELASARGLQIVEDACQAHGAERDGFRAGTAGIAGCFSFYPGKNLGAMGDAGALRHRRPGARRARAVAARARPAAQVPPRRVEGYTSRLDTIQALVLRRKLPLLDGWNDERRAIAAPTTSSTWRASATSRCPRWPQEASRCGTCSRRADGRPGRARGATWPSAASAPDATTPTRCISRRPTRSLGYGAGAFPVAEQVASRTLSLPIFPGIREEQLEHVVDAVRGGLRRWLTRPSTRRRTG